MSKKRKNNPPIPSNSLSSKPPKGQITQVTQQFSGPLPHPDVLNRYDQIVPGAAERILIMAEEDAKHQRGIEKAALQSASSEARRGQIFGLIIGVFAFSTCIVALSLGSKKTAIAIGSTTVVGLVTVFVTGHIKKSNN